MRLWTHFILCLLLSASIWLIHNLSQTYTGVVSVSVLARSSIRGRAAEAREGVTVNARCSATGFRLLRLQHSSRDVLVDINPEDFVYSPDDDKFVVSGNELAKYSSYIFGESVSLVTFLNQSYSFSFDRENYKTVPVRPVWTASYKSQYMALGPMHLHPDSVTVYGESAKLATVDAVLTRPFSLNELSRNESGIVRLSVPQGVRISDTEVTWSLDVVRYVECRSSVPVGTRNVPAGLTLSVFPSIADAVFLCVFPMRSDPSESEFYVDYADFAESVSGKCVARADDLPQGVIEWRLEPEVFECMEMEGGE